MASPINTYPTVNTGVGNAKDVTGTDLTGAKRGLDVFIGNSYLPTQDSVYVKTSLLNGASEAMNVDGSVTPAHFDFTPSGSIQYYLESLTVFLEDAGSTDIGDFGVIPGGLTNGLRILVTKSATDYELANIKNNRQLASVFSSHPMLQSNGAGFFNATDNFAGTLILGQPVLINGSSDKVRVTVRDNLSTLDALSIFALLRRVL